MLSRLETISSHQPNSKKKTSIIASVARSTDPKFLKSLNYVPAEIYKADAKTPDNWIYRDSAMVRLTGKHPFNAEPPLDMLMSNGFITPTALHYVRNHGAVPKCEFEKFRLSVDGLVSNPMSFTMQDILSMPSVILPVTLVCAGNRRKEQNMIKQSKGFSWGPSAVSTAVWKGVLLKDVLDRCCIVQPESSYDFPDATHHVGFEGIETLPGGFYGTSIPYEIAMDPTNDIILAYEMNGLPLTPDHGYPLRIIIPGYIGGRMVKWLHRITITKTESQSHYHFHDNRVLPSHVDADLASSGKWWFKPEYIINQLNINSVISSPGHAEVINPITHPTYTLAGYAYTGGGRKITRVEVSFDGGATWELTEVERSESRSIDIIRRLYGDLSTKHPSNVKRAGASIGRYWCWVFWKLTISSSKLIRCNEVVVRAWDSGLNTQPDKPTWNVMGMMQNSWFRVKVHLISSSSNDLRLQCEHPTQPGNLVGGWMVPPSNRSQAQFERPKYTERSTDGETNGGVYGLTIEDVLKHDKEDDCWIIVENKVFDVTTFLKEHPGGAESITMNAGADCTEEFNAIHSTKAHDMLKNWYIGDIVDSLTASPLPSLVSPPLPAPVAHSSALLSLDGKSRTPLKLHSKTIISHDTRIFRFSLASLNHRLGLPIGNHVYICARKAGSLIMRAYTPISSDELLGYVDFLIKVYYKNIHPKFPEGGAMTQYLDELKVGDEIEVKGPIGHFTYLGNGYFKANKTLRQTSHISMVAGGTGITPMLQLIQHILSSPTDRTKLSLIYANRTPEDILLKDKLDNWAHLFPTQFKVYYTVDSGYTEEWKGGKGHVCLEMCKEAFHCEKEKTAEAHLESIAVTCGPPGMIEHCVMPIFQKLGYDENHRFAF